MVYLLLLIPDSEPVIPSEVVSEPFLWNRDAYWDSLEASFQEARQMDSTVREDSTQALVQRIDRTLSIDFYVPPQPSEPMFDVLERDVFQLGALVAAAPEHVSEMLAMHTDLRRQVKHWSQGWDMESREARDRLYRLLYGTRTAVEEVLLQGDPAAVPPLAMGTNEPSETPSAEILGVTIHSGDILVSRGGAPTSALIARGNDYPGNFSHVALVFVDEATGEVSIIESHIEVGVAVANVESYLRDTKLRLLVLRPGSYFPALQADPMLPHKAAVLALERAQREHVPYDFAMDYDDSAALFCSEVASAPYHQLGVDLWMGISHISSPGVRAWLAAFGVRNFRTQEPSDLEYDPQLTVVAEWRDPETLWKDHLDNAIIDAMLERADEGERLGYDWYLLPVGRVLKAYSMIKNWFGCSGPIPEGMSATSALKNDRFSARHTEAKTLLIDTAEDFVTINDYRPPYWELVRMARIVCAEIQ